MEIWLAFQYPQGKLPSEDGADAWVLGPDDSRERQDLVVGDGEEAAIWWMEQLLAQQLHVEPFQGFQMVCQAEEGGPPVCRSLSRPSCASREPSPPASGTPLETVPFRMTIFDSW